MSKIYLISLVVIVPSCKISSENLSQLEMFEVCEGKKKILGHVETEEKGVVFRFEYIESKSDGYPGKYVQ